MSMLPASLLPIACLAAALSAQGSAVIPPANATQAGNALDREPFGLDQVRHVQYIDRALLGNVPPNTLLKEVAYRRSPLLTTPATMTRTLANPAPLWTLRVSNHTGSVQNPAPQFPLNTNTAWTTVFNAQVDNTTNFPPLTLPASGLPSFLVRFPFSAPYVFTGAAGFGIDHYVYDAAIRGTVYYVDAVQEQGSLGRVEHMSPTSLGCPAGQNRAEGTAPNPGGGNLEFFLYGAPANTPAWACLGASATQWGALQLPYSLAPLGLPGCFVYTDWSLLFSRPTNVAGISEYRTPVPASTGLLGGVLYGQWAVQDGRVNPAFPLATSDGLKFTLGSVLGGSLAQVSVVSAIGNLAQGNGRSGFVQPGRGLIVQLAW
jgi:hypothetical protein